MHTNARWYRAPRAGVGLASLTVLALLGLGSAQAVRAGDDIIITLKNDFIKTYKDRVTIETTCSVDAVLPHPHKIGSGGDDGDIHFSGRAPEVQLPIVAEIMNARREEDAVRLVRKSARKAPIKVAGAWRLWCEHANTSKQIQGGELAPFGPKESNPDHVFEVHPVTRVGDISVLDSIGEIDGYQYKDATAAFQHFDNVKCIIRPNADGTTTLRTGSVGYNYAEFILESLDEPANHKVVEDDRFFFAAVRDTDGELINRKVRMAFLKDTDVEEAARQLPKGGRLHVVAIPRIDPALVSWRVQHADDPKYKEDEPLTWNLPYEMIVVGAPGRN